MCFDVCKILNLEKLLFYTFLKSFPLVLDLSENILGIIFFGDYKFECRSEDIFIN